jgi:hypothetical protein
MTTKPPKTQDNTKRGGCCLHRIVRGFFKKVMIHSAGWMRVDGTDPALVRAYLRRDLRCWNRWPRKGWSDQSPIPKSLLERGKPKHLSANVILHVTSVRSDKMPADKECKTQNIGGQECEGGSSPVTVTVGQLLQMMQQREPLQIGVMVMMAPCSPNERAHLKSRGTKPACTPSLILHRSCVRARRAT